MFIIFYNSFYKKFRKLVISQLRGTDARCSLREVKKQLCGKLLYCFGLNKSCQADNKYDMRLSAF